METMLYDYILYEKTDDIVLQKKKKYFYCLSILPNTFFSASSSVCMQIKII